jgi:mRNA-degrading endonuclease RelE of RelBE toxin-antitoxin system
VTEDLHRLRVTGPTRRGLDRLPTGAAAAVAEFLVGDLVTSPRRVGKPLRGELSGTWAARRGPYRVTYEIDQAVPEVVVLRVDHRADVYRRR